MCLSLFSSEQCIMKQLLDSAFVISQIIKVSVLKCYQPRPDNSSADNMHLPRPWVYRILQKKEKKHTNSIARFQARASSPAVSFACLKLHNAAKEKKYKYVRSLNVMSRAITRTTVVLKETLLAWFQMQIRVKKKKVTLIVQISFAENILKQKRAWPSKTSLELLWCSIGAASSPTIKGK